MPRMNARARLLWVAGPIGALLGVIFLVVLSAIASGDDDGPSSNANAPSAGTPASLADGQAISATQAPPPTGTPGQASESAPGTATDVPAAGAEPTLDATRGISSQASAAPAQNTATPQVAAQAPPPPTATVPATPVPGDGTTPQNFRVAFLGDQGDGKDAHAVLNLVKTEGAQMLLLLGDYDYDDDPNAWDSMLTQALGTSFPIFGVIGNHDEDKWSQYRAKLTTRLSHIDGASCTGDYGVNAQCTYRNLFFVLSGAGTMGSGHASFIRGALAGNDAVWSICAWHKNQRELQVGDKDSEVGWEPYEACRQGGAIVATAHEHSYERTRTLSSMSSQTVDSAWPSATALRVSAGSTFAFVSGLGGKSIRDQERCKPVTPPYGCNNAWGSIYTEDQDAEFGALFIDFNVDGDPHKARGYFKNLKGQVVDNFTVVSEMP